jgi:competence protein ComEC
LLASALAVVVFVARRRVVAFAALALIAAAVIGFAIATLKTALIAHPVLERPLYGASITGFIETHEERERTDRIVIEVVDMDGDRVDSALERVRLTEHHFCLRVLNPAPIVYEPSRRPVSHDFSLNALDCYPS